TDASGWTAVELPSGLQGLVPTSYVDMSEYKPPPIQHRMLALNEPKVEYVVALYDFSARDPDELSFAAGDRIRVVSREIGDGWIQGALSGGLDKCDEYQESMSTTEAYTSIPNIFEVDEFILNSLGLIDEDQSIEQNDESVVANDVDIAN
ncbi:Protein BZZ1, partial [Coemansia sp. S3946]